MEVSYKFIAHVYNTSKEECDCTVKDCNKHTLTYFLENSDMLKITNPECLILIFSAEVLFSPTETHSTLKLTPTFKIIKEGKKFSPSRSENIIGLVSQTIINSINAEITEKFKRT